jgi:DNA-binding transcriptional MocR family regulator
MKLETFALERFQSMWENRVAWNISESGVHPLRVSELVDAPALHDALLDHELGYPQTNGTAELRETIAALYPGATSEHVQVTNGGSEANCVLLMRLVEPGDEIVFMTPNYMQAAGLARGLGARVRPWRAPGIRPRRQRAPGRPTPASWRRSSRRRPRRSCSAIRTIRPGRGWTSRRWTRSAASPAPSAPGLIDDEIYRGAEREADDTPSVWGRYDRAIVSSGLSKAYALPGLRIGWLVAPPSLAADLWAIHDYTTIAPGGISDRLARIALASEKAERSPGPHARHHPRQLSAGENGGSRNRTA